jgi:hypothetical protein
MPDADVLQRLARLEAVDQIRQLVVRYALGIDTRDIDAVVELFVDDGRPVFFRNGDEGSRGGAELRRSYMLSQSQYTNSQHFVLNHRIELDDDNHAHGVQYGLVEQEIEDRLWTICATIYNDKYERVDGRWLFAERRGTPWYFTAWNDPPVGPNKLRWPSDFGPAFFDAEGNASEATRPHERAIIPAAWPSWQRFWSEVKAMATTERS